LKRDSQASDGFKLLGMTAILTFSATASAAEVLFFEFSHRVLGIKKRKGRLDYAGPFPFRD